MNQRKRQAEQTRGRILRAAFERFAADGYVGTSTRSIAKAAGVSEGVLFHHFPTKLDLLRGVGEAHPIMAGGLTTLVAADPNPTPEAFAKGLQHLFLERLHPDRPAARLFRVLLSEGARDPRLSSMRNAVADGAVQAVTSVVSSWEAAGRLRRSPDPQVAARALLGGMFWVLVMSDAQDAEAWTAYAESALQDAVEEWLAGLL